MRAIQDKPQAQAPPSIEIASASTRTWRRTRQRLDPMAMRMAISRARSAVRAAKRLPRLAQAASSTMPARAITPPRKRARAARRESRRADRYGQLVTQAFFVHRILLTNAGGDRVEFGATWDSVTPSLSRTMEKIRFARRCSQPFHGVLRCLVRQRNENVAGWRNFSFRRSLPG